jgi:hypothetical protein
MHQSPLDSGPFESKEFPRWREQQRASVDDSIQQSHKPTLSFEPTLANHEWFLNQDWLFSKNQLSVLNIARSDDTSAFPLDIDDLLFSSIVGEI